MSIIYCYTTTAKGSLQQVGGTLYLSMNSCIVLLVMEDEEEKEEKQETEKKTLIRRVSDSRRGMMSYQQMMGLRAVFHADAEKYRL